MLEVSERGELEVPPVPAEGRAGEAPGRCASSSAVSLAAELGRPASSAAFADAAAEGAPSRAALHGAAMHNQCMGC